MTGAFERSGKINDNSLFLLRGGWEKEIYLFISESPFGTSEAGKL
jgi:hypothetical protein